MSDALFYIIVGIAGVGLFGIMVWYFLSTKRLTKEDLKYIKELKKGTENKSFSLDVTYQKLYVFYTKVPFIKRYLSKLRRRLEILNVEDEYLTRKQTSEYLTKALLIVIPLTIIIIALTRTNTLLMFILLIFEIFITEIIIESSVDKLDNKILKQQIDFFAEIRHAYHETNMVEEAIYQVAQDDEKEVSAQAQKIYEVLISDDPETELEKYYDVAPNSYLKEFAGISYLTREFGDRKTDKGSLYLKNVNNITEEMQIEILKRDKLNYVFQSLSIISILPALFINAIKDWSVSQFSFTSSFYNGQWGFLVQTLLLIIIAVCFVLIRKVKDTGGVQTISNENPWQKKLYEKPYVKKFVNMFVPKQGTKEYRTIVKLLKDAASKQKMEWLFINRLCLCVAVFFISIFTIAQVHRVAINLVYTEPTNYNSIVGMSTSEEAKAKEQLKSDNVFLDKYRGKNISKTNLRIAIKNSQEYQNATDTEIDEATDRIYTKLQTIDNSYFKWLELVVALALAYVGYMAPIGLLYFQAKMRALEMEDEVMQFQTIILMLMKIERVNVEMILEWLERYANIFKEPITRCVNDYESGAWEALEQLKNDTTFPLFIRIVESLQAAVEKIPIVEAFDELDTERDYYQEKRKQSNERLISRKGLIGKVIGFAPMVCLFVGYLIVPLVVIGLGSMNGVFSGMQSAM
jgi:hypothetical protein